MVDMIKKNIRKQRKIYTFIAKGDKIAEAYVEPKKTYINYFPGGIFFA